ncbi:MAG: hypothetical protein HYX75_20205 [Acidobacteria bacterium]|nr:hypothetical protein [Acidobacteriota bacterium]
MAIFLAVLAAETIALGVGIRGWWLFGHWDISHPDSFFAPLWVGCALSLSAVVAWLLARRYGVPFEAVVNLPLLVLLLQPFKPRFFLTNSEILPTLPFAVVASLVLRCYLSGRWPGMKGARRLLDRFLNAGPGPQARVVFIASLLIYLFLSSNLLFPVYPFTGDEPHYLILTHSIVHEADTNLYDNYYVNKDYKLFYPGELEAHTHAKDRIRQQSYSNHMPGAAFALVPFYWPAAHMPPPWMVFFIRFGMNFYTAVLVAQAFLLMRRVFEDSRIALAGSAFLALTPPLVLYSRCVYPEVFAGLLMIVALRVIIERRTSVAYLPASLALAAMPWFGTKYAIFAVAFTIVFGILRLREGQHGISTYIVFLVPLVLSAAALLLFLKHYYGEYSPDAIYHPPWNRPEEPVVTSIGQFLLDRSRALLGYFYDQRIGLLVFAPAYLMALPGAVLLWRRRPREASVLVIIAVFYTLFYAYNMSWGGQAPPSRPMVSITPILATFVAAFIASCRGGWRTFRNALLVVTTLFALILLRRSDLLYDTISNHDWQGRSLFLTYLSNPYVNLTRFVPQFLEKVDFNYAATWIWFAIFASITLASLRRPRSEEAAPIHRHLSGVVLICAGTLSIAVLNFLEPGYVLWRPPERVGPCAIHRLDSRSYPVEAGGFWTRGGRTTQVVIEADESIGQLSVSLSPLATNRVTFRAYNRELLSAVEFSAPTVVPVPLHWTYRWHDKQLYCLTIGTRRAATPAGTGDSRSLGVFVQLRPSSSELR